MTAIRSFICRVKRVGVKRPGVVRTVAMGREREFLAWDVGDDTFIFEKGVSRHLGEHPSVLVVSKSSLRKKTPGRVLTMTTGNHSVAAFPLLDGRFWKLSRVPKAKHGDVLMKEILCANVVKGTIEISQRDVPGKILYPADEWLLSPNGAGFALNDIVMGDRNVDTLEYYRRKGEEWRVKPLAWTEEGMRVAIAASKKRISTRIRYYHSMRGVHFMPFSTFKAFAGKAETDYEEFVKELKELVSIYEGQRYSFVRMPKHRFHHEIELFGLGKGAAQEKVIPALERLMESIALERVEQQEAMRAMDEITSLYESLLTSPEMADESTRKFAEALYMNLTGEVYSSRGEGAIVAFDDRRTALPGASFEDGIRPKMHPGSDARTKILLTNLRELLSKDERIEYVNIYELHSEHDAGGKIGEGKTREIVYKTDRGPFEHSRIEKPLSKATKGYSSYMLARIQCFKALGIALASYRILRRQMMKDQGRMNDFFIRNRLEGESMEAIPADYFCNSDDSSVEEKDVVLAVAMLMGDAAAQNMAMKKFDPQTRSPLYGVGKEIYEFEFDIMRGRIVPKKVSTCSVRGSFGWPDVSIDEDNLHNMATFYMAHYAHALKIFQKQHNVTMLEAAAKFMEGFEYRTKAMEWQLSVMRDRFEDFDPKLPENYRFVRKWRFVMWSLERQMRRLPILRRMFYKRVEIEQNEDIRSDSEQIRFE